MAIPGYLRKLAEKVNELPSSSIKNDLAALVTAAIEDKIYCSEKEKGNHEKSQVLNDFIDPT